MKKILLFAFWFISLFPGLCYSQDTVWMTHQLTGCENVYWTPSNTAKPMRVAAARTGEITVTYTDCDEMPDSLRKAVQIAYDVWRGYLKSGELKLEIRYGVVNDADISVVTQYIKGRDELSGTNLPMCLYRKLYNESNITDSCDAVMFINKNTNWAVGVGAALPAGFKNLSYTMMQAIAMSLGYGTSLSLDQRGQIKFYATIPSIFDSLVFSEDNTWLKDLRNSRPPIRNFAQHQNGDVYVLKTGDAYKLYAPTTFNEHRSLKYSDCPSSMMYHSPSSNRDLIIDDVTLEILDSLGWISPMASSVKIVAQDIPETGIASAYQSHTFNAVPSSGSIDSYLWTYQLPLATGGYDTICTSVDSVFTIPAISNENRYAHTIEGDINGRVAFVGMVDGLERKDAYNLTLELKPHILSIDIIDTIPCDYDETYYNLVLDITYEGSHDISASFEYQFSTFGRTYYSSRPYYTRFKLCNLDSWEDVLLTVEVNNDYGMDWEYIIINAFDDGMVSGLQTPEKVNRERNDTQSTTGAVYALSGKLVLSRNSKKIKKNIKYLNK